MNDSEAAQLSKWQSLGVLQEVKLHDKVGGQSDGKVYIQSFSESQRLKRALKSLGIFWGIAVVCVAIPGLHFILVPIFLIAGPIAFSISHKAHSLVLGGTSQCPACGAQFNIPKRPNRWPLSDVCAECGIPVKIEKK